MSTLNVAELRRRMLFAPVGFTAASGRPSAIEPLRSTMWCGSASARPSMYASSETSPAPKLNAMNGAKPVGPPESPRFIAAMIRPPLAMGAKLTWLFVSPTTPLTIVDIGVPIPPGPLGP